MLPRMNAEQVRAILRQVEQGAASASPERQKGLQLLKKLLEDRLKQLEGGNK